MRTGTRTIKGKRGEKRKKIIILKKMNSSTLLPMEGSQRHPSGRKRRCEHQSDPIKNPLGTLGCGESINKKWYCAESKENGVLTNSRKNAKNQSPLGTLGCRESINKSGTVPIRGRTVCSPILVKIHRKTEENTRWCAHLLIIYKNPIFCLHARNQNKRAE